MKKLKIGVMGCADIAQRLVLPAIAQCPELQLVAIASRTQTKAELFATQFGCLPVVGYENLLKLDIDAVYMPLPTGLHHEFILKTLNAGKHILAEKSLANSLISAKEMVETARKNGLMLMENFQFQFHSQHQYIKNLLQTGEIGSLRQVRAAFGFPLMAGDNFRYRKQDGGGALLDTGAYMAKIAQFLLGETVRATTAQFWHSPEFGVDMGGSATFQNQQGITAQVAWGFDNFYQCNYELWGSQGKITAERAYTASPTIAPKITVEKQGKKDEIVLHTDNHFVNILSSFAQNIAQNSIEPELQKIEHQAQLLHQMLQHANYQLT